MLGAVVFLLIFCAALCEVVAATGRATSRWNLIAAGLFLFFVAVLLDMIADTQVLRGLG